MSFIARSFLGACRWVLLWVFGWLFRTDPLREAMARARTYEDWKVAAEALDARDQAGSREDTSSWCDEELIRERTALLERLLSEACETGDAQELGHALRTGLRRNLGGVCARELYDRFVHPPLFVCAYLTAVVSAVSHLAQSRLPTGMSAATRELLLRDTRHSFGGSALLLSGGASLGMIHFGLVRLLLEQK